MPAIQWQSSYNQYVMKRTLFTIVITFVGMLTAAHAALTVPSIVAPIHGSTSQAVNVMLDWGTSTGAIYYQYKLSTNPSLAGAVAVSAGTNSYVYASELLFNTNYYWQVRAMSATDSSSWSVINQFSTMDGMTLVTPANNATSQVVNIMLDWSTVSGITYYDVEIDTNATFSSPAYQYHSISGSNSYYYTSYLLFGTKYFWRCRARHSNDTTTWSATWNFTTHNSMTLGAPANNATSQSVDVMLDWSTVSGITFYDVEIDTNATFSSPAYQYHSVSSADSYYYTSNLLFGTKYFWRCRARHSNDTTTWSAIWSFTTHNYLYLITPVNNATMQSTSVLLGWNSVTGITYYDVEIDTNATFSSPAYQYHSVTSASSNYYTANLLYGTKYFWRCRARHAVDTSTWSVIWNFTTHNTVTLVAPVNNATQQNIDVMLDWSTVTGTSFYDIEIDTNAAFSSPLHQQQVVSGTISYYYPSSLLFGTKYYWRCRARHSADTTAWSATWNFTTLNNITLVAPLNNATAQNVDVMLDWSTVSGITYYDIEIDTNAAFSSPLHQFQSISSANSYFYTSSLLFGTKYYWHCRARHATDTTVWSATWNFTTMNSMTLVAPANSATNQAVNVMLDWGTVSGITAYDVQFDTSSSFSSPLAQYQSGVNSYYYTSNLRFNTTYYWRVRSRHTADTSVWSPIWSFTTGNYPTLISPANASTGISLNPTLDWGTVNGVTAYQYEYSTDPLFTASTPINTGTTSQAGLINLSYGQTYYWRVRCGHAADTSDWSNSWYFTTLYQLTTPVVLSSPVNTATGLSSPVSLSWQTYAGAVFYEVQYDNNPSFTAPVTGTTVSTSQATAALAVGTTYYWKVRANNGSGYSPWSSVWSFSTVGLGVPVLLSPTNGATGQLTTGLSIDWTDVSAATFYEYEYGTDILFVSPAPVAGTNTVSEASISGLSDNTTYYWRVRSSDGSNYSAWSSPWSFTTVNTVGIQENNLHLLIYPNPATVLLTLEFSSEEDRSIEVYDLLGQLVLQRISCSNQKYELNISELTKGTYILRILGQNKTENYRFIKQ
jgi:hypothetical protein